MIRGYKSNETCVHIGNYLNIILGTWRSMVGYAKVLDVAFSFILACFGSLGRKTTLIGFIAALGSTVL